MNCKACKTELTSIKKDGKHDCYRCLTCKPYPKKAPPAPKPEDRSIDVRLTEARVREIVRDEIENWCLQRPPVSRAEIESVINEVINTGIVPDTAQSVSHEPIQCVVESNEPIQVQVSWREQAKALGIPLAKETGGARKKINVLADIEAATVASSV